MINIAIDGPSGVGKSTVSQSIAERLNFFHVDTGALYRAVAFYIKKQNIDLNFVQNSLNNIDLKLKFVSSEQHVFLNGDDVSNFLRDEKISGLASYVAKIKEVRIFLLDLQRNFAKNNNVIMDGRDIATVVLPNAQVKIFLTASTEARADRRYKELLKKGLSVTFDEILKNTIIRDKADCERQIAPLKKSPDAIEVDTSCLNFEETIQKVIQIINKKLQQC